MNKVLAQKVKDKCKDMGLSEEYLNGITEVLGADVADDSTDNEAIETVANRISDIAKRSQGEATRWAQKNKPTPKPDQEPKPDTDQQKPIKGMPDWFNEWQKENDKRMKALEDENNALKAERLKETRSSLISSAMAKHNIPDYIRKYVSVPESTENDKIEEFIAGMAQEFVTQKLPNLGNQQPQVASKEATEAAADAFFKTHVKQANKD